MARAARSRAAGVAMQDGREGALPGFLLQDRRHVVVGIARMDDQRQAGLARRRDVVAEALLLRLARAVVVVVVEPGFADRHHLGMARRARSGRRRDVELLVRADADGCRPSSRRPESVRRSPAVRRDCFTRVEMVTMRPTPAARARATTPSRSSAKSGKSRWQWLSTSMVRHLAARWLRVRHSAGTPGAGGGSVAPAAIRCPLPSAANSAFPGRDGEQIEQLAPPTPA